MKVLLTTLNAKFIHTSLALRTIKAYCKQFMEVPIKIQEFTINEHVEDVCAEIFKQAPDITAFSCYIWNISQTLQVARRLKKVDPGMTIVLGGPEVSFDACCILKQHPIDYIIQGEGEYSFLEFLRYYVGETAIEKVPGLCFKCNGSVKTTSPGRLFKDLDVIPFAYEDEDIAVLKDRIIYYESSRGCPFSCGYCLSSTTEGVRFYSLERVKQDLSRLIDAGATRVKFVDRTFNCNPGRAMKIWEYLLEKAAPGMNFHFEICADLLTDDMLDFLGHIPPGLFQFEIGVQTTHGPTMSIISRKTDLERLTHAVHRIGERKNIHRHLDLIAGLPGEPLEAFKKSFNDVYLLKPEKLQLGFLKLLKGSRIRKEAESYGYEFTDEPPYEVLQNDDMPYRDLLLLKMIERILELYLNSHKFDNTLGFLTSEVFRDPFEFYARFSGYWEQNGLHRVSHSLEALYSILYDFCGQLHGINMPLLANLLKFDYVLSNRYARVPGVIERGSGALPGDEFKQACFDFLKCGENVKRYLPHYEHLPAKEIYKKVRFEAFAYNVLTRSGPGNFTMLFNYDTAPKIIPAADAFLIDL